MRTTSSLESMNAVLRRICPNHPHLFKFIDCLRLHELSKSIDMLETVRSDAPVERLHRRRLLKNKRRNFKIKELTRKLEVGTLTPSKFLEGMANADVLPETCMIIIYIFLRLYKQY